MMNYGQSKGLIQVSEPNTYGGSDPMILGRPLAIEYNSAVFEDDNMPAKNQETDQDPISQYTDQQPEVRHHNPEPVQ